MTRPKHSRKPRRRPTAAVIALTLALLAGAACTRTVLDPSSRAAATPMRQTGGSYSQSKVKRSKVRTPKISTTDHMQAVMSAPTGSRETFNSQIRNAVDAGEGDLQARAWRSALARNPDDIAVRVSLARYYKELGFPEVALEHYRLAAARFPGHAEVATGLARTLNSLGQGSAARTGLQQFVTANPDASADAFSWLGILQDDARDFTAAEASHRGAIRLRQDSDAFHNNLGYNLLLQGKANEAAVEFRRALALSPFSALAKNNLAMALVADPSMALSELRLVADPATAHSNLAAILIEGGELGQARTQLEAALRYQQDHPAALRNLQLLADLQGGSVSLSGEGPGASGWHRFMNILFGSKDDLGTRNAAGSAGRNEHSATPGSGAN